MRVMATGRGITDTKIYDRDAVVDRYGIPPELIPDFYGLKGDTSDNIPGVPGIGDKTAAQLLQRFGDLEAVLASVDEISGAKRKENLTNHAEDARVSKRLATSIRDVPVELDLDGAAGARARPLPAARDVPRVRAARPAAPPGGGARRRGRSRARGPSPPRAVAARAREAQASALGALEGELATLAADRPVAGRGPAAGHGGGAAAALRRLRRRRGGAGGRGARGHEELLGGWGDRPVVAHDWKALASAEAPVQTPPLEHDTVVAAYLIDPARRGYPLAELVEEAGLGADVRRRRRAGRAGGASPASLAERQRALLEELELTRLLDEVELPLVDVLVEMERAGREARRGHGARRSPRGSAPRPQSSSARSGSSRARSSPSARRSSWGRPVRQARACRRSAAARPASRPTPACSRPSAPSTRSCRDRDLARADQAQEHLPRRVPRAAGRRRPAAHHLQPDRRGHRAASRAPTPTCRTSRSAPSWGARSAPASSPRRATG